MKKVFFKINFFAAVFCCACVSKKIPWKVKFIAESDVRAAEAETEARGGLSARCSLDRFNVCNVREVEPFFFDEASDTLRIDRDFWETHLTAWGRSHFEARRAATATSAGVDITDDLPPIHAPGPEHPLERAIYSANANACDYENWWAPGIPQGPEATIIELPNRLKPPLEAVTQKRWITGNPLSASDRDDLEEVADLVAPIFSAGPTKKFMVRLSSNSAKHDFPLYPIASAAACVDYLSKSRKFLNQEYLARQKRTCIIAVPWSETISSTKKWEFRLFMRSGSIVAASQQEWNTVFEYSEEDVQTITRAIETVQFLPSLPFKTCVLDTWIEPHTATLHLIEVNPWGPSGSALFHYLADHSLLYSSFSQDPELRLLKNMNECTDR